MRQRPLRFAVAAACAYETFAIVTGKVPTISTACTKYQWLAPLVLGGLTAHLYEYAYRRRRPA
jgi:hypothetical protein